MTDSDPYHLPAARRAPPLPLRLRVIRGVGIALTALGTLVTLTSGAMIVSMLGRQTIDGGLLIIAAIWTICVVALPTALTGCALLAYARRKARDAPAPP